MLAFTGRTFPRELATTLVLISLTAACNEVSIEPELAVPDPSPRSVSMPEPEGVLSGSSPSRSRDQGQYPYGGMVPGQSKFAELREFIGDSAFDWFLSASPGDETSESGPSSASVRLAIGNEFLEDGPNIDVVLLEYAKDYSFMNANSQKLSFIVSVPLTESSIIMRVRSQKVMKRDLSSGIRMSDVFSDAGRPDHYSRAEQDNGTTSVEMSWDGGLYAIGLAHNERQSIDTSRLFKISYMTPSAVALRTAHIEKLNSESNRILPTY